MDEIITKYKIKVAITINNDRIYFFIDYSKTNNNIELIINEIIINLKNNTMYDTPSLKSQLRETILNSIEESIKASYT